LFFLFFLFFYCRLFSEFCTFFFVVFCCVFCCFWLYFGFEPCFWMFFLWQFTRNGSFTSEFVELVAAEKESSSIIVLVGTDPTGAIVNSSACLDYKTRLAEVNMAEVDPATQILPLVYHSPP